MSSERQPKPFSKLLRSLTAGSSGDRERLSEKDEAKILEWIAKHQDAAKQLISIIFPNHPPSDRTFYERVERLRYKFQDTNFVEALVHNIVPHLITDWTEEEQIGVLESLLETEGTTFFLSLRHLPQLLPAITSSGQFCGRYFLRVRERIGNDSAQEPFWAAISRWTAQNPSQIAHALTQLQESRSKYATSIGACIIGTGRSLPKKTRERIDFEKLEKKLGDHSDPQQRLIVHRSWSHTADHRRLASSEFRNAIDRMFSGTDDELTAGFAALSQLLPHDWITHESLAYGASVLCSNANRATSDNSRHLVICATRAVNRNPAVNSKVRRLLIEAFLTVQPVSEKNANTWRQIQGILVGLMERDFDLFYDVFCRLIERNPKGMIYQLSLREGFTWLLQETLRSEGNRWYEGLFFSSSKAHRRVAFKLYDEQPFNNFSDGFLDQMTDHQIALAVAEFQIHGLHTENVGSFLIGLLKRAEMAGKPLKDFFFNELFYQAKNLPGACLDRLKQIPNPSALVRKLLTDVDDYFEKVVAVRKSPLLNIEIPGLNRARKMYAARQSRLISQQTKSYSTFASLFRNSYLLYGGEEFRYCRDGEIGELSATRPTSVSSELPRLYVIDPEYAAKRRHDAIGTAAKIESLIHSSNDT